MRSSGGWVASGGPGRGAGSQAGRTVQGREQHGQVTGGAADRGRRSREAGWPRPGYRCAGHTLPGFAPWEGSGRCRVSSAAPSGRSPMQTVALGTSTREDGDASPAEVRHAACRLLATVSRLPRRDGGASGPTVPLLMLRGSARWMRLR
jgi:hypothetical protein